MFQVTESAEIILDTLFSYRDKGAYHLHEFVIMSDHLHLLLTPGEETSFEKAVQLIKGGSLHRIHKAKAPFLPTTTRGLKSPPPKEKENSTGSVHTKTSPALKPAVAKRLNVGAKAPPPDALTKASGVAGKAAKA